MLTQITHRTGFTQVYVTNRRGPISNYVNRERDLYRSDWFQREAALLCGSASTNRTKMHSVLRENKNSVYNILKKCSWYTASRVADAVKFLSLHISYQTYAYVGLYIYFRYCLGCSPSTDLTARLLSLSNCFFIPTPNVRDDK